MTRVIGLGGVFFKTPDPGATGKWYQEHLGIDVESWGGACLKWKDAETGKDHVTVWSPFAADTTYFGDGTQEHMLNFIVEDLDAVLAALREEGVTVEKDAEDSAEGRFAWILDPDGRRVELWQPA